jgi:hypothetical protein
VMIHFCGRALNLIALLKLCAAAALHAINANKGNVWAKHYRPFEDRCAELASLKYRFSCLMFNVINSEDYIIYYRHSITNINWLLFHFLVNKPIVFGRTLRRITRYFHFLLQKLSRQVQTGRQVRIYKDVTTSNNSATLCTGIKLILLKTIMVSHFLFTKNAMMAQWPSPFRLYLVPPKREGFSKVDARIAMGLG